MEDINPADMVLRGDNVPNVGCVVLCGGVVDDDVGKG
jgi:hypothetical protein